MRSKIMWKVHKILETCMFPLDPQTWKNEGFKA